MSAAKHIPLDPSFHVHYLVHWADDATTSQFAQELRRSAATFRILSEFVNTNYRTRLHLYALAWPRLIRFALRQGLRSLLAQPRPDVVVVSSHIELAVLGLLRTLIRRKGVKLVLSMFIYTHASFTWIDNLKQWYLRVALSQASVIICHSQHEVDHYTALFQMNHTRFTFVPYALHVDDSAGDLATPTASYVVSAGRSGRDYDVLIEAFKELPYCVHIVCDSDSYFANAALLPNVIVLQTCYGECYLREIKNSSLVVIPLKPHDISAGQMVMLQAMFYGKPVIITRTATTSEYVQHNDSAWLVKPSDHQDLRIAVTHLLSNVAESKRIGENGRRLYEKEHSMPSYVRHLENVLHGVWQENKATKQGLI